MLEMWLLGGPIIGIQSLAGIVVFGRTMKKSAVTLLILIFLLPLLHGQKTRYGQSLPKAKPGVDYPLALHISGMRVRMECWGENNCANVMYADAVVNGKKVELSSDYSQYLEFSRDKKTQLLGDYQARIISKNPGTDLNIIGLRYEVLLHDRSILRCRVTGVFE